jgi:outer membrane protein OmpA-like peptidoglycan-associated protein
MKSTTVSAILNATLIWGAVPAICQQVPQQAPVQSGPAPIYHVTVTERTVKAINYQYRSGPTMLDFRGTVLMPKAKGEAVVESKQGHSEVDVRFDNLLEPSRFGKEYLTYVLWALTPDGRPHNIGEVVANGSDKAHLRVTTDYQAFAMIVTAEPYSAVRLPSDVVVLENQVRPDTIGKIEQVEARYELMPRGQYAFQVPEKSQTDPNAPKVSMRKYEELSELYQAENALAIAHNAKAEQYAPNTFAKAQGLITEARQLESSKGNNSTRIIQAAREAAQTAEDARQIADRRQQEEKLAKAQAEVMAAKKAQVQAEAEVARLKAEADAAKAQADAERAAKERAEADAAAARRQQPEPQSQLIPPPPPVRQPVTPPQRTSSQTPPQTAVRMRMLEQLNGPLATRDTPRGLIAVLPNSAFSGASLSPAAAGQIARVAAIVAATPGLRFEVEGHTESADNDSLSSKRAYAVRDVLISRGIPASSITARGLGNSRPITSSSAANAREENQRVEIVVMGDQIGNVPIWDKTYALR